MTQPVQEKQEQIPQPSDKELNFRKLEQKLELERQAREQERQERLALQEKIAKIEKSRTPVEQDEDDDSEPYVDHKRLQKKLSKFEKDMEGKIDQIAEKKAHAMIAEEKRSQWLRNNPDFQDIMQHAQKFADHDPELAETILNMPEGFERQKLVYKNIKALGLHKPPEPKKSEIQDTIDRNRRTPYYQPSGVGTAPYASQGDFSASGMKNSYEKMQELKRKLRLG